MQYKFIKFGPEGFPLFYYDEETYPPTEEGQKNPDIPADAIEVSVQQWLDASMLRLWRAPDGTLTLPPAAEPGETIDLPAYAAQKRWETEVGGIEINGLTVATDDRSKTMISGARVAAQNDPQFSTQWKAADGTFTTINAAAVIAISDAMLAHVSNCFAIEARVLADIEAGTISTVEEIDAAFA
ncbi:DUF4376 domain-containing protein [Brucella inopinata]|uniref:DUF4376 domain-containing protein n=1 Tax=Brucella inopinata TaxID=1218315 RepID=UPI000870D419|nr:DUF4376 domain-containing protein [Brucella inopinata]SCD23648.1 hypothetical protein BR141012304_11229 [Brucella inopinata]